MKTLEELPKIINIPIHSNDDCFFEFPDLLKISSRRTFCGGTGAGNGVCKGDSGSGMAVMYEGAYYLRGIVSSSLRNIDMSCDVNKYSIFTDVLKFSDWIHEIDDEEVFE